LALVHAGRLDDKGETQQRKQLPPPGRAGSEEQAPDAGIVTGHDHLSFERLPDVHSYLIQHGPPGKAKVLGTKAKAESIPLKAGDDMQVDVKDLLTGDVPICEEEVHPFAAYARTPDRIRQHHGHLEHVTACPSVEVSQIGGVDARHDEQVPGVDRLDVHEGHDLVVGINQAGRCFSPDDVTKHTR
jgi:hypothetical protein